MLRDRAVTPLQHSHSKARAGRRRSGALRTLAAVVGMLLASAAIADFPDTLVAAIDHGDACSTGTHQRPAPTIGFIPGALYGSPDEELGFSRLTFPDRDAFDFPLHMLAAAASEYARPLTDTARQQGLTLEPEATALLRLATFFEHEDEAGFGGAGIADADSTGLIVVIHVDRPGRILGKVALDQPYEYDVELPRAGFHLLRYEALEGGGTRVTRAADDTRLRYFRSAP